MPFSFLKAHVSFSKFRPTGNKPQVSLALVYHLYLFPCPSIIYFLPGLIKNFLNVLSNCQWDRGMYVIDKLGDKVVMVFMSLLFMGPLYMYPSLVYLAFPDIILCICFNFLSFFC